MLNGNVKENDDDIMWLGRKTDAPYCAYGDDAKYEDILLYAFLVIERTSINNFEHRILQLKEKLEIPEDLDIHTKDFFNGYKREKWGIDHLNVSNMINEIIAIINTSKCAIFYNFSMVPEDGKIYPDSLEIAGKKIHGEHKAIVHQIGASCFVPFVQLNGKFITLKDIEVFVSQETTRVKTVGASERQAQYMSEMRIPTTYPVQSGHYARLKPHYVFTRDHICCQIADVIAYVFSHALSKKCKNPLFRKQMRNVQHKYRAPAG